MKTKIAIISGIIFAAILFTGITSSSMFPWDVYQNPPTKFPSTFTLTVSNQSFDIDPVDILVKIDGKTVIDDEFLVKQQHNYQDFEFDLNPGIHTLYAESIKGKYQLKEKFTIRNELWAWLDFQYYEGDETLPELRLIISETKRLGL